MSIDRRTSWVTLGAVAALALGGCSSSGPSGPVGGPVTGALDTHCTVNGEDVKQEIGACMMGGGDQVDPDAGTASDYGDTMYNAEGNDDDCKYHISWTSTAIREDQNVTFTV